MIRYLTAGESHGRALVGILEGIPAGLAIREDEIAADLARRQLGYGRGERMQIERDRAQILSGVRYGKTIGSPVALLIANRDFENWQERMRVDAPPETERAAPLTTPRPGHADYAGAVKYGFRDIRNVIERSSARETAMRVALGAIGRKLLAELGIAVASHVIAIHTRQSAVETASLPPAEINRRADANPMRCLDDTAAAEMIVETDAARTQGDTVGGVFEVIIAGLPVGIGSYAQADRRLDAVLGQALLSIPAVKGCEIGTGFAGARQRGSALHDRMAPDGPGGVKHLTNRAGGIEGGLSTGEPIILRAAMKPLSTLGQPLETVDLATGRTASALRERSDICAVPAAAVVGEAVCILALLNPVLEKYGGDSMDELRAHVAAATPSSWH